MILERNGKHDTNSRINAEGVLVLTATVHMHVTAWFTALVLFGSALVFRRAGMVRAEKIIFIVLRIFYLFIIATGVKLLSFLAEFQPVYILKTVSGLFVISLIEMVSARDRKGKNTPAYWILLALLFVYTLYLGIKLPL